MWHASAARDAKSVGTRAESSWRGSLLWQRRELSERIGLVPEKNATLVSWPNYDRKESQLLCHAWGEAYNLKLTYKIAEKFKHFTVIQFQGNLLIAFSSISLNCKDLLKISGSFGSNRHDMCHNLRKHNLYNRHLSEPLARQTSAVLAPELSNCFHNNFYSNTVI